MKTFKDNAGRTWTVAVNIAAAKRVKSLLNVNLMDAVENDLIKRLATDPILLCDVIYAICKPEADARNISDEQFGQAMAGDAIEHATVALLEELVDFFPEEERQVLRKALRRFKEAKTLAVKMAGMYLESPAFDKRIEDVLKDITDFSGNLPESPE